jgi:two-component system nitrogen regulation response regulator GlnG
MEGRRGADDFERLVTASLPSLLRDTEAEGRLYRAILGRVERPLLRHALEMAGGNQLKAARLLGINRNTLRKRLRLLGLLPARHRNGDGTATPLPRSG